MEDFYELSPITGENTVMSEVDSNGNKHKLCMKTGYATNDNLINDSDYAKETLEKSSTLVNTFKITDSEGYLWLPMNTATNKVAIFPKENLDDYSVFDWAVCPIIAQENREYSIDYDNAKLFGMFNFPEAFEYFLYENLTK